MEVFLVYLWLKLDGFIALLLIGSVLSTAVVSLTFFYNKPDSHFSWNTKEVRDAFATKWNKPFKRFLITAFICFVVGFTLPTSKETAILVGTSYAVDFAKSPEGAKIGSLIRKKANDYLDEQLKEVAKPSDKAGDPK